MSKACTGWERRAGARVVGGVREHSGPGPGKGIRQWVSSYRQKPAREERQPKRSHKQEHVSSACCSVAMPSADV